MFSLAPEDRQWRVKAKGLGNTICFMFVLPFKNILLLTSLHTQRTGRSRLNIVSPTLQTAFICHQCAQIMSRTQAQHLDQIYILSVKVDKYARDRCRSLFSFLLLTCRGWILNSGLDCHTVFLPRFFFKQL